MARHGLFTFCGRWALIQRLCGIFPKVLTRAESNAYIDKLKAIIPKTRLGFLGCGEFKETQQFIGFCGFTWSTHTIFIFSLRWNWLALRSSFWGKGYALEAANAALAFAFDHLQLETVVSFTTLENLRSEALVKLRDEEISRISTSCSSSRSSIKLARTVWSYLNRSLKG